ncbi:SecY subunit domain-containing protein [Phlyctochytrium arcticum]|nr:SecY subunit domain-containing protein [Phlyctochytrium arcticum]
MSFRLLHALLAVQFKEKVMWTAITLFIFLSSDPMYWMRVILASNRGTLMEMGITPIVTFAMVIAIGQATVSVWSGVYGDPKDIGAGISLLLILPALHRRLITMLLDEIAPESVWRHSAPLPHNTAVVRNLKGAVVALFHLLFTRHDKFRAVKEAISPVKSNRFRAVLTHSNMPIMLQSCFGFQHLFHLPAVVQALARELVDPSLGVWKSPEGIPQEYATSGFAYYIHSPPHKLADAFTDPIHFVIYVNFMLSACAFLWLLSRDVARQLKEQGLVMRGHRDVSMYKELKRIIPTAAAFGGLCIGALSVSADLLGAIGSGTGILLAVTIIYQYFEIFVKEQQEQGSELF